MQAVAMTSTPVPPAIMMLIPLTPSPSLRDQGHRIYARLGE